DPISVGTSLAAILPFVYGLKELARTGAHPVALTALAFGTVVGVYFVRRQRRLADPLVDVRLFANRKVRTSLVTMMTATLLAGAMMLFLTEHMQLVSGLSATGVGVWMLAPMVASLVAVLASPLLARRIRPAYLIAGGIAIVVVGLSLNTAVGVASGPLLLIVAWSVTNLGAGPFVS